MNVDNLVQGLLNKSLKLKDIPEDKIDEVIDALSKTKEDLTKQLPQNMGTMTNTTMPRPAAAADINQPGIAEQVNIGGMTKPVNKKEKIDYFANGQWDIRELDKSDDTTTEWSGTERRNKMNLNVSPIKERRGQKKEVQLSYPYKESKAQAKDDLQSAKTSIENAKRHHKRGDKDDYHHALDTGKAYLNRAKEGLKKPKKEKVAKSGYKGYTEADNIRRKAKNISDKGEGDVQSMPRIKRWGKKTTGTDLDRQVKEMKRKTKKSPVKVYTKEEIQAYEKQKRKTNH